MPSSLPNTPAKLYRSNAVWDLTAIPDETPLQISLKIEIHSTDSPLKLEWESSSLTKVLQLRKFISGMLPLNFRLEAHDQIMLDDDYLYEYCLVNDDIIKVICE